MVISLFLLLELLLDKLTFLPSLTAAKLALLVWCLLPDPYSGSRIIFSQVTPLALADSWADTLGINRS